jgi:hypothetical protein
VRKLFVAGLLGAGGVAAALALILAGGTATAAHPIDALLRGTFTMKGTVTMAEHVAGEHAGQHVTRSWSFYPNCSTGGCSRVVLKRFRSPKRVLDTITLSRHSAGVYAGKHRFWLALNCNGAVVKRGGYANETITVRIVSAVVNAGTRTATGIRATYNNPSRFNQTRCPGGIGHDAAKYSGRLDSTAFASTANGGYLILSADGGVYNFGKASLHGSDAGKLPLSVRAVRIAADPMGGGYWILRSNGGVDAFGATASGSLASKLHGTRAVAIAPGTSGGYLILTADGGVHPFGKANWHGSDKGKLGHGVNAVGLAVNGTGGYWVLKSNGGVDGFGAPVAGSLTGKLAGTRPVSIAAGPKKGYWILTSNGGVHAFGGSGWHGSDQGKLGHGLRALSLAADPATGGYWILKSNGGVDAFSAPSLGSLAG